MSLKKIDNYRKYSYNDTREKNRQQRKRQEGKTNVMKTGTKTAQEAELFLIEKVANVVKLEGDDFALGKCKAMLSDDGMIAELF
jgi:hypothetical protein